MIDRTVEIKTAATHLLSPIFKSRFLRFPIAVGAVSVDAIVKSVFRKKYSHIYALSFMFEATKPDHEPA